MSIYESVSIVSDARAGFVFYLLVFRTTCPVSAGRWGTCKHIETSSIPLVDTCKADDTWFLELSMVQCWECILIPRYLQILR